MVGRGYSGSGFFGFTSLAQRVMRQGGATPEERITLAFRLTAARRPSDPERQVLVQAFHRVLKQYQADRDAALILDEFGVQQVKLRLSKPGATPLVQRNREVARPSPPGSIFTSSTRLHSPSMTQAGCI